MPGIQRLTPEDHRLFTAMLDLFSDAFDDPESYDSRRPRPEYCAELLSNPAFVALVAVADGNVVGSLVAYELPKFEQERSEFYIYDLAVATPWRRRGVATRLIDEVRAVARKRGAWVLIIQADGDNDPAIALYSKLGVREDVLNFDISVD